MFVKVRTIEFMISFCLSFNPHSVFLITRGFWKATNFGAGKRCKHRAGLVVTRFSWTGYKWVSAKPNPIHF